MSCISGGILVYLNLGSLSTSLVVQMTVGYQKIYNCSSDCLQGER